MPQDEEEAKGEKRKSKKKRSADSLGIFAEQERN